ncbi:hypothetical protein ACYOEI_18890, partial [Singulisphaera rosea]
MPFNATESETSVRVELGPRSYEVRVVSNRTPDFGAFARSCLNASWAGRPCQRALLVTDENVAPMEAAYVAS